MTPDSSSRAAPDKDRLWLCVLGLAALLGFLYNGAVLVGYGPDEMRHMNYVTLLLDEHRLPQIINGVEYRGAHSLHPPFYYFLLVPILALFRGLPDQMAWHIARLVSLGLCLGALVLLRQIALAASANWPTTTRNFALFVTVGVGLLPIFGMTAGTINNDAAMLFTVTLFLWLLAVKFPDDRSFRAALILGVVFGLGGGSKATALVCDGAALVAYLTIQNGARGWLKPRVWARFAVILGVALAVCGWWYFRNIALYGQATPIALGYSPADMGMLPAASQGTLVQMMHPNFPPLVGRALAGIFTSLWSQIDWIPAAVRAPIYWGLLVFVALGLIAATRNKAIAAGADETALARRIALWSGGLALLFNAAACLFFALFVHWGWFQGGRYLLASLGGLMLLLATGWRALLGEKAFAAAPLVLGAALLALNALTLYWLVFQLNPLAKVGTP